MIPYCQSRLEAFCRTCLRTAPKLFPLFEDDQLCMKIKAISNVEITLVDKLPKGICNECLSNLNLAFNLRNVIINTDIDLKERLKYLVENQENPVELIKCENNTIKSDEETFEPDVILNEDSDSNNSSKDVKISMTDTEIINKALPTVSPLISKNDKLLSKVPSQRKRKVKTYRCVCGFQTTDYEMGRRHRYTHRTNNAGKNYECKQCDFKTMNRSEYHNHKGKHVRMSVCNICGNSYRSENLTKHIETHMEATVTCDQCGKVFKNKESMRHHTMLHRGKLYKCEICGAIKKYSGAFARHKRKHMVTEETKVKCTLCDKRFFDNLDLKKHMKVHTGERPYPCSHCPKRLSSSYALKTHQRQHTKEKPFICQYCSMAFRQRVSLKTHIAAKHPTANDSTSDQGKNNCVQTEFIQQDAVGSLTDFS